MIDKIRYCARKIKVFIYLLPGIICLMMVVWLTFFYTSSYQHPYEHPINEFSKYIKDKDMVLEHPEIAGIRMRDGDIQLQMIMSGNYLVFVDVYYNKKIGSFNILTSNQIHKSGFYKQFTSDEIVVSGHEIRQMLYPDNPDSIVHLRLIDILILETENNKISNPVRISLNKSNQWVIEKIDNLDFRDTEKLTLEGTK